MTDIVTPPAVPEVSAFPAPEESGFNVKAYNYGVSQKALSDALPAIIASAHTNAIAAQERATAAAGAATAAAGSATTAAGWSDTAETHATTAAGWAATALNAPGTSATSATSITPALGSKTLTVQPGKLFTPGQPLTAASAADPANRWFSGRVVSYNSETGELVLEVDNLGQILTAASDWIVSLGATAPTETDYHDSASLNLTSADATLTIGAPQVQVITAAADGRAVNLPDPASYTQGGFPFILVNRTAWSVAIMSGTRRVGTLTPGATALCTVATGQAWRASILQQTGYGMTDAEVFYANSMGKVALACLSDTLVLIAYQGASTTGWVMPATIDGDEIIPGASLQISGFAGTELDIVRIDDTRAVVAYKGTTNYGRARVVSYDSGPGTISFGAEATFESATIAGLGLCACSSSLVVAAYSDGGNNSYPTACAIGVSGTTLTPGTTPMVINTFASSVVRVLPFNSSGVVAFYGMSSQVQALPMTIGGGDGKTFTKLNAIVIGSAGGTVSQAVVSGRGTGISMLCWFSDLTSANEYLATVSICNPSGTWTAKLAQDVELVAPSYQRSRGACSTRGGVLALYATSTTHSEFGDATALAKYTAAYGSTTPAAPPQKLLGLAVGAAAMDATPGGRVLLANQDASGYGNIRILEA